MRQRGRNKEKGGVLQTNGGCRSQHFAKIRTTTRRRRKQRRRMRNGDPRERRGQR